MRFLIVLGLLASSVMWAQESKQISGRVRFADQVQRTVTITNTTTGEQTQSDSTGFFLLTVQEGDQLTFVALPDYNKQWTVGPRVDQRMELILSEHQLEEIVIDKKVFVDQYFGAVNTYTPAERRFRSGNRALYGEGKSAVGLDPVFNWISGKRKKQNLAVRYEWQENQKARVLEVYTVPMLQTELGLAEHEVTGFLYYLATQPGFADRAVDLSLEFKLYLAEILDRYQK